MRNLVSSALANLKRTLNSGYNFAHQEKSTWMQMGLAAFNKTRFSSHIQFIRKCLRENIVPNGFKLKFHLGAVPFALTSMTSQSVLSIL